MRARTVATGLAAALMAGGGLALWTPGTASGQGSFQDWLQRDRAAQRAFVRGPAEPAPAAPRMRPRASGGVPVPEPETALRVYAQYETQLGAVGDRQAETNRINGKLFPTGNVVADQALWSQADWARYDQLLKLAVECRREEDVLRQMGARWDALYDPPVAPIAMFTNTAQVSYVDENHIIQQRTVPYIPYRIDCVWGPSSYAKRSWRLQSVRSANEAGRGCDYVFDGAGTLTATTSGEDQKSSTLTWNFANDMEYLDTNESVSVSACVSFAANYAGATGPRATLWIGDPAVPCGTWPYTDGGDLYTTFAFVATNTAPGTTLDAGGQAALPRTYSANNPQRSTNALMVVRVALFFGCSAHVDYVYRWTGN